MTELSIIIPTYHEDKPTFCRCLDSLLFLTDLCQWEAWVIDDGHPSDCVQEWLVAYDASHFHLLRQPNQGQSVARNVGIEHATGTYIMMVDADDELLAEGFRQVWQTIQAEQPDLVGHWAHAKQKTTYRGNALHYMEHYDINPAAWGYIMRRSIIGTLRYTPGIVHEDEEFNTLLHLQARTLWMTDHAIYHYHVQEGSTMHTLTREHLSRRFHDVRVVISHLRSQQNQTTASALQRRILVLAMCQVVNILRLAYDKRQVDDELAALAHLSLYPLPSQHPHRIHRYWWIRLLTPRRWMVHLWHFVWKQR